MKIAADWRRSTLETFTALALRYIALFLARLSYVWTTVPGSPFPPAPHFDQRLHHGQARGRACMVPVTVRREAFRATRLDQGHWT